MDSVDCICLGNLSYSVETELIFLIVNFKIKYKTYLSKIKCREAFINLKIEIVPAPVKVK